MFISEILLMMTVSYADTSFIFFLLLTTIIGVSPHSRLPVYGMLVNLPFPPIACEFACETEPSSKACN